MTATAERRFLITQRLGRRMPSIQRVMITRLPLERQMVLVRRLRGLRPRPRGQVPVRKPKPTVKGLRLVTRAQHQRSLWSLTPPRLAMGHPHPARHPRIEFLDAGGVPLRMTDVPDDLCTFRLYVKTSSGAIHTMRRMVAPMTIALILLTPNENDMPSVPSVQSTRCRRIFRMMNYIHRNIRNRSSANISSINRDASVRLPPWSRWGVHIRSRHQALGGIFTAPPVIRDTQMNLRLRKVHVGKILPLEPRVKVGVAIAALSPGVVPGSVSDTKNGKVPPTSAAEDFIATTDRDDSHVSCVGSFIGSPCHVSMVQPMMEF